MSPEVTERLFGWRHAFDHPVTVGILAAVAAVLVLAPIVIFYLEKRGKIGESLRSELRQRCLAWALLAPLICGPILLGAAWTIAAVGVLSILCYAEFARATGLFREKLISLVVVLGILAVIFSIADHWYGLFMALGPLTTIILAAVGILPDQPRGYIQRFALGSLGFLLFGVCLGHLGYWANDRSFRPVILAIILAVEMNDVFAYVCGKSFGRRKLAPNTSPNKTVAGAVGALVLTTSLFAWLGHEVFRGGEVDQAFRLIVLGLILSVAGQLGDLMLSSIKRDIGIKDMSDLIPGHGGILDRFNSMILTAPAVFHYVGYFQGVGLDQPARIFTGG
jgi:phosphatidate cytidylyltransferase